jgi:hypothetical protein
MSKTIRTANHHRVVNFNDLGGYYQLAITDRVKGTIVGVPMTKLQGIELRDVILDTVGRPDRCSDRYFVQAVIRALKPNITEQDLEQATNHVIERFNHANPLS